MSVSRGVTTLAVTGLLALGVAACGSSGGGSSSSGGAGGGSTNAKPSGGSVQTIPLKAGENPVGQVLTGPAKKHGGTLTVYSSEDFEHLDPGESYFTQDYGVDYVTQRAAVRISCPTPPTTLSADLATEVPTTANGGITDGGKTVTVHIRQGVHFSPPVNREVTSADVAYAIERGANPNVANPYFAGVLRRRRAGAAGGRDQPQLQGRPDPGDPDPEQVHDRLPHDQAGGRVPGLGAQPADLRAGAAELRGPAGQEVADDLRHQVPGGHRART